MRAWLVLSIFAALQLALMKLPGARVEGPMTSTGYTPVYKANGLLAYSVTMLLFYMCSFRWRLFPATLLYDIFPELLGALTLFSLMFCTFLLIKGYQSGHSSGNLLFDFYWGTELYPHILGVNVKHFTNCRFGMMSWPLLLLSFASKQEELYGSISDSMLLSVNLQLLYITKFFIWETGYLRSLDIMHDKAGYYIIWGVLVAVPGIYTSPAFYLVSHPNQLGAWAPLIGLVGAACILVNFWADYQRQHVRETHGNCTIWGRKPTVIVARYVADGKIRENLLLASGWWSISRHFHYLPELLGAFCWSVPALFTHAVPYFYLACLCILLIDRAYRDDRRCSQKYGIYWKEYCELVPYKIVPYLL
jgi:7-dehydrocholesterol reductase